MSGVQTSKTVEVRYTKWDGTLHWHFDPEYLGEDEHGLWLGAPKGCLLQRGDEPGNPAPHAFACLIPAEGWWTAYFNVAGDVEVYIDLTDRPRRIGDVVHAVDLDLDVLRWRDGRVTLEDEDEFLEHQQKYAYPEEVVKTVEEAAGALLKAVRARDEPFGSASEPWRAMLGR